MRQYILNGHEPVPEPDPLAFAHWFGTADRRVARTPLGADGRCVSTVFLGYDHSFGGRGAPVLFETMVFLSDVPDLDEWQERYCTWDEAALGHEAAVRMVLAHLAEHRPDLHRAALDVMKAAGKGGD